MRNKQVEFNPYIYTLSKLYRFHGFGYEISVFNTKQNTNNYSRGVIIRRYTVMSPHGKLNVKFFLIFIVAENTRIVNINQSRSSFPSQSLNFES